MLTVYKVSILMNLCIFTGIFTGSNEQTTLLKPAVFLKTDLWREKHLEHMVPEQLSIVANVLHLRYTKSSLDLSIQTLKPMLINSMQKMLQIKQEILQIINSDSDSDDKDKAKKLALNKLALLKVAGDKLKNLIAKRRQIITTLESVDSYFSKHGESESAMLVPIMNALKDLPIDKKIPMQANDYKKISMMYRNYYQEVFSFMKEVRKINSPEYYKQIFSEKGIIPKEDSKDDLPDPEKEKKE